MEVPFKDVFVLLLYLLPGFLSLQLKRAKYPAKKLSDIETIIWSVAHTFFIHVILAGLSALLSDPWLNFLAKKSSEIGPAEVFTLMAVGFLWGSLLYLLALEPEKTSYFRRARSIKYMVQDCRSSSKRRKMGSGKGKRRPSLLGLDKRLQL